MLDVRVYLDTNGKDLTVEQAQDCTAILERNAELRTQEQRSDWGKHVASIPNVMYVKWLNEEHAKGNTSLRLFTYEFDQIVRKKLQDPDFTFLRVDKPPLQCGWTFDK